MFKLLVITLVCATVVLAVSQDEQPEIQLTSTARPSSPALRKLSGLNQSSSYLSQDAPEPKAPNKRLGSNSGSKLVQPAQQQPNSLDNLGGQFSQQKGQQARPTQPRQQQSNLDFTGHF